MQVVVLREHGEQETRVALTPESVKKLVKAGATVAVESGAGQNAGCLDNAYGEAGASVQSDASALAASADVLLAVDRPSDDILGQLKPGTIVISFMNPLGAPQQLNLFLEKRLTALSMEMVPRITRAQSMDALSSMATVVGYKAVLLGAQRLPRMFPLLMTAAGTVPPARVLVIGAGVAGLQAIATARRLGARVEAYDVRKAAGEQVESLGATFLDVDLGGLDTEDAGGYAKELSEEALDRGRQLIAERAAVSDVIITTAQIPGRRAPLMLLESAIDAMRPGSVVVDLAGGTGGNCPLTRPGEVYEHGNGVVILSPLNLAATVPVHASQLYSRNITALFLPMIKEGGLNLDFEDEVIAGACVVHDGGIRNPRVAAAHEKEVS